MQFVGKVENEVGFVFTIDELTSLLVAFGMTNHTFRSMHALDNAEKYGSYSLTQAQDRELFDKLSHILEQVKL